MAAHATAARASGVDRAHHLRSDCRACGESAPAQFLDLGPTPLANAFPQSESEFADERSYPLGVYLCERCGLVQLLDVIDPEVLFRNYIYVSGTSETLAEHHRRYADSVVDDLRLKPGDLVVEVASNDGSLLKHFQKRGVRTLGIEPAVNIAELAAHDGIETLAVFFNADSARRIRELYGRAQVVVANNVLAHVDNVRDFLSGATHLIARSGRVIIEAPYLDSMIERVEYDTIYHEHLSYFSITALLRLFESVGLSIVRVEQVAIHGGSIRVYGAHADCHKHAEAVLALAQQERSRGLTRLERFERFAEDVRESRAALVDLLSRLRDEGRSIAGYGAPAKGNTLLNYCRIGRDLLDFTVDRNPLKIGRFTPGAHLPVLPTGELCERRPDYTLILAWNFADEIIRQQSAYARGGGRFILPTPPARILSAAGDL